MTVHVYGITQCSTVKKARAWLEQHGIVYQFHDFKKELPDSALLQQWIERLGWERLINRRGTTWRQLPADIQNSITTQQAALALMQQKPSVIRRPVAQTETTLLVGFDADEWHAALSHF